MRVYGKYVAKGRMPSLARPNWLWVIVAGCGDWVSWVSGVLHMLRITYYGTRILRCHNYTLSYPSAWFRAVKDHESGYRRPSASCVVRCQCDGGWCCYLFGDSLEISGAASPFSHSPDHRYHSDPGQASLPAVRPYWLLQKTCCIRIISPAEVISQT